MNHVRVIKVVPDLPPQSESIRDTFERDTKVHSLDKTTYIDLSVLERISR